MNPRPDGAMERRKFQIACLKCRKRKTKCDNLQPCSNCKKAKAECVYDGSGEKRRPLPRGHVQALKGQVTTLENFITRLAGADNAQRDEMLAPFRRNPSLQDQSSAQAAPSGTRSVSIPIRSRTGHLRRRKDGNSTEFYGATSLFQISPSEAAVPPLTAMESPSGDSNVGIRNSDVVEVMNAEEINSYSVFTPKSDLARDLMAAFFRRQYPYQMCLYREYFLRDYHAGKGPYYSDLLMYAICSMGALSSGEIAAREWSDMFFNLAQQLLYGSALESPNLTTLQALILLGHREIGHGKTSKGWLFSGMAFRLAHEMGLHLDPNNWNSSESSDESSDESRVEREIRRRTYWGAFAADNFLSLYFGRPCALYPGHSDVHDTIRIPYPDGWEGLLSTYIMKGQHTLPTAFEDGMTLVNYFVQQVELCKILHRMITEVFENRNIKAEETVLATSIDNIDVALTKWLSELPANLHWNEWSVGQIPALVLHLHMLYHTAIIILHRPPRSVLKDPEVAVSQDVQTCYESLEAIIKLLRTYSRYYQYHDLPFTFVHTLATAASVLLMKRYIEDLSRDNVAVSKPLGHVLEAIDAVSQTWPCARQVRLVVNSAMEAYPQDKVGYTTPATFDLMMNIPDTGNFDFLDDDLGFNMDDVDFELYTNDNNFLDNPLQWVEGSYS